MIDYKTAINSVCDYFKNSQALINYTPINICPKSTHPLDEHMYIVIAKEKKSDTYAVWSCWNTTTQSLNHGHYRIPSYKKALELAITLVHDTKDNTKDTDEE